MNENSIQVLSNQLQVKEWEGQRVITFQDIDTVHQRPRGTASRNFRENEISSLRERISSKFVPTKFVGTM